MPQLNKEHPLSVDESIRNLLILNLLKDGVDPQLISIATNIPEKTIRNKFPMRLIKGEK